MKTSLDLQSEIDACLKERRKLTLSGRYVLESTVVIGDDVDENCQLVVEGTGDSAQLEGFFEGPLLLVKNPRRFVVRDLDLVNHVGDGVLLKSFATPGHVGSSGNNSFYNVNVNAKGLDWLIDAKDGADFSASSWFNCDVTGGGAGWRFVGSNNLNPHFFNCTGSFLDVMYEFSQGGSGHVIVGGGPSHVVTGILSDQGFPGSVSGWCVEDCQTALRLTSGPGTCYRFEVNEIRGTKFLVDSATNSGNLCVSVLAAFDKPQVKTTGTGGFVSLSQAAASLKVSKPVGSTLTVQKANVGFLPAK